MAIAFAHTLPRRSMLTLSNIVSRPITAYPYAGHTFVCNQIVGIADVQEVFDSALHVIQVGDAVVKGCTIVTSTNTDTVYAVGSNFANYALSERPIVGVTNGIPQYPWSWENRICFELIPQMLKYCLVITIRIQGENEFANTNFTNVVTGAGGKAGYMDITMNAWNSGGAQSDQLINRIWRDYNYHQNQVPVGPRQSLGGLNWENQPTDLFWDGSFPPDLIDQKIRQLTIVGNIDPALVVNQAQSNIGAITFKLAYPLQPIGTVWNAGQLATGTTCHVDPAAHPITGIDHYCDGVIDFELYLYA